jgi:hypothetical protein
MYFMGYVPFARRKEKPPEYEEMPIIGMQNVTVDGKPDVKSPSEVTEGYVIPGPNERDISFRLRDAKPDKIVSPDTPTSEGVLELWKPGAREKGDPPKIITQAEYLPEKARAMHPPTTPTQNAVTNIEDIPRTPIDETVAGFGKVFGKKNPVPIKGG